VSFDNAVLQTLYSFLLDWSVSALTIAAANAYGIHIFSFDSPSPDDKARVRISRQPFSGKSITDTTSADADTPSDTDQSAATDQHTRAFKPIIKGSDKPETKKRPTANAGATGTVPVVRKAPVQPFKHVCTDGAVLRSAVFCGDFLSCTALQSNETKWIGRW
jgi:hypothetical protein